MSGSFLAHMPPTWRLPFSENALARGLQYSREGRVRLLREDARFVEGSCRGAAGNQYRQSLQLSGNGGLSCICSCPVGLNCKHAAALILYLERQAEHPASNTAAEPDDQLPGTVEHWLSQLSLALGNPQNTGQQWCLHYRVMPDVHIEVYKVRLRTDGSFGERQPYYGIREASFRQPRFMQPLDLHIAALLTLGRGATHAFMLSGENGGEALRLILETGRAYVEWTRPPLQSGLSRQARFNWTQQPDGSFRPSLDMNERVDELLTAVDPLYYLDEQRNEVGLVNHGLTVALARHLLAAPSVPSAQAALFSLSLNEIAPQLPAPAKAQEQRIDDVIPIAQLALGSHHSVNYQPSSGRMVNELQHRAGLSFVYGKISVHGNAKAEQRIRQTDGERVLSMARQPAAEQALRQQLKHLGFRPSLRQSLALPKDSAEMYELPSEAAWLHFVQEHLPQLREKGWWIAMQPGFAYDLTPVDAWYVELDEPPEHNWFDLELGIIVEGERISLLPVLLGLIRRNPALLSQQALARRADDETLRVQLDKRRAEDDRPLQVLLPFGRLKAILATLAELYLGGDQPSADIVRLGRADAARLTQLDALTPQWHGGEQAREFAQRLRDYRQQTVSAPVGLNAQLRPYQLDGLRWMQTLRTLEVGGILGDDMGLGKTLQTLAHLLLEKEAGRLDRPCLVVMPTSLIPNWQDEAARFAPALKVVTLHGSSRQQHYEHLTEYDVLFTTYALLPRDIDRLVELPLHVLVLDEAQNIKNASSKAAQAAGRLNTRQRLCLTGTPLENHLGELWSLFNFLMPGWLGDAKRFNRDYRNPIEKNGDSDRLQHLTNRIKPFLLRRRKEQVARELPAKNEILHWVELNAAQRDLYETVRLAMDSKVRDEIDRKGLARSQIVILDALLKLRQVCCDLRLVKSDATKPTRGSSSGKLDSLMEMLTELLAEGRRILLFSQFTSMLALIEEELRSRAIDYVQITGDTKDRRTPVRRFQSGEVPLFLISLKAGGTGLNLTAADTVIHYDPWWNPAAENQATDRAHRIGQDKPVFVYKLIARATVEEKIQQLQRHKAELAAGVLDAGHRSEWQLEPSDIEALFAPLP
ncbi:DEAD/DEAH box helicase [Stutzerimonas stutzeri]|uniref:DEAD/DEAH box helicase n=1 Tax=Stutzerimonas stutzeri TaxID=316 RepID=UPI0004B91F1B|nr:DEAD/DEAH box helicase [Stutzerimonas stutzeri]MCQ4329339.1 DEAD/DEAH box helicase [Stutzerimonas stutzeri]